MRYYVKRRGGEAMKVSMPHCKVYRPEKFRKLTDARQAPRYDPILMSALEYTKHYIGLGYRMYEEFICDFPRVRKTTRGLYTSGTHPIIEQSHIGLYNFSYIQSWWI